MPDTLTEFAPETVEREAMEYDVVIVGAGPAGLAAAIRLKQLAAERGQDVSVAVLEKGSEVGAHILSGAVIDPRGLNELIPDWKEKGAPLETPVTKDKFLVLGPAGRARHHLAARCRRCMHNHGNYIASLGNLCRWLAQQAEALGVEIYPGMAASELVYGDDGRGEGRGRRRVRRRQGRRAQAGLPAGPGAARQVPVPGRGRARLAGQGGCRPATTSATTPSRRSTASASRSCGRFRTASFQPGLVQHTFGWPLDDEHRRRLVHVPLRRPLRGDRLRACT